MDIKKKTKRSKYKYFMRVLFFAGTDTGIRIPVLNTAITGKNQSGIQYRYSVPGKKQSGTQYRYSLSVSGKSRAVYSIPRYSVPGKIRAVLNTVIQYRDFFRAVSDAVSK
jgi:hypothetical protein